MDAAEAKNSNGNSASVKGHDQVLKSSMNEGRMVGGTSNKNYIRWQNVITRALKKLKC